MSTSPAFSVVIPSHNHGRLLTLAVDTVLHQTVQDFELLLVLDGADETTTTAARNVSAVDARIRLFENPKGERLGEVHRSVALEHARGRFVAYLSDDDLWLPDHLEHVGELLEHADFVGGWSVFHNGGGRLTVLGGDLADASYRQRLLAEPVFNFVGLSQAAHTMNAYRNLGRGWHPGPTGVPGDLHMWRHFLESDRIRAVSGSRVTVFTFPSPPRAAMAEEERYAEMTEWRALIGSPPRLESFLAREVVAAMQADLTSFGLREVEVSQMADLGRRLQEAEDRVRDLEGSTVVMENRLSDARAELARLADADRELREVTGSLAYRAARRVAAMPGIRAIGRIVARMVVGGESGDR